MSLSPKSCAEMIRKSSRTVAMTGAGISTAAGIPDFRSLDGIYSRYDPSTFEIDHFRRDPTEFFRFTRELFGAAVDVQPTLTHRLLAEWEATGRLEGVVTQNIDPLHHRAGSKNVVALHGTYGRAHCQACGRAYDFEAFAEAVYAADIPRCNCPAAGVLKPDVVFFGEAVHQFDAARELVATCELLLVLGSSLVVQPAAALPMFTSGNVIVVNRDNIRIPAGTCFTVVTSDLDEYFAGVVEHLRPSC